MCWNFEVESHRLDWTELIIALVRTSEHVHILWQTELNQQAVNWVNWVKARLSLTGADTVGIDESGPPKKLVTGVFYGSDPTKILLKEI